MNPTVSVIIPIYNVSRFLDDCLRSVTEQDYRELEIICVDDGSTDDSGQKAEEWEKRDSRIRLIRQRNGGLSDARNTGIQAATGEFIAPVDSDDYLSEQYISTLVGACEETGAGVGICDICRVPESAEFHESCPDPSGSGTEPEERNRGCGDLQRNGSGRRSMRENDSAGPSECDSGVWKELDSRKCLAQIYHPASSGMSFTAWGKIYRKFLYTDNGILYPKGRIHEDQFVTYRLIYAAGRIVYVPEELYCYRQRKGSITNSGFDLRRLDQRAATREQCDFFLKQDEAELSALAVNNHIRTLFSLLACMRENGMKGSEAEEKMIREIRQDCRHYLPLVDLPAAKKEAFRAAAAMPENFFVNKLRMF